MDKLEDERKAIAVFWIIVALLIIPWISDVPFCFAPVRV